MKRRVKLQVSIVRLPGGAPSDKTGQHLWGFPYVSINGVLIQINPNQSKSIQIIHFRNFPYEPSIFGDPHYGNPQNGWKISKVQKQKKNENAMKTQCRHRILWFLRLAGGCTICIYDAHRSKDQARVCLSLLPWSLILQLLQARSERFKLEPNQTKHTRSKEGKRRKGTFLALSWKTDAQTPAAFCQGSCHRAVVWIPRPNVWHLAKLLGTTWNNMEQLFTAERILLGMSDCQTCHFFFLSKGKSLGLQGTDVYWWSLVVEHEAVVLLLLWQLAYLTGNLPTWMGARNDFAWFRMILHDLILILYWK